MGIPTIHAKILFYSKTLGVSFDNTLMLGRQNLYTSKKDVMAYARKFFDSDLIADKDFEESEYSEPLFKNLGAGLIDSMDNSTYEGATIIHDLNLPVGDQLKDKYNAIVDGGTLEHIFNFPIGVKNCMEMLQVGGHFISFVPANNECGHGFYQFSPELFYRVFCQENGFEVKLMAMHGGDGTSRTTDIFLVKDPDEMNNRVELLSNNPVTIIVVAKKIEESKVFELSPQQSDYSNTWTAHENSLREISDIEVSPLRAFYRKKIPKKIRDFLYHIYDEKIRYKKKNYRGFAKIHKNYVEKLKI